MTTYHIIKGTRLTITNDDGVLTLPCLAGSDTDRKPGTVCVSVVDGHLRNAEYGYAYDVISQGDDIKGWRELDGQGTNIVNQGGKHVTLPACVIEHMVDAHGLVV